MVSFIILHKHSFLIVSLEIAYKRHIKNSIIIAVSFKKQKIDIITHQTAH